MTLIALTVVVIAFLIAALAIHLFTIGWLLNRTANNLDDCLQNVKMIGMQAAPIGPGVVRLNRICGDLVDALPLLYGGAERLIAAMSSTSPLFRRPLVMPRWGWVTWILQRPLWLFPRLRLLGLLPWVWVIWMRDIGHW